MEYKKLGKTNLIVSKIGFGGIPIMTGHESEFLARLKGSSYQESIETVRHAYNRGINFFDTAIDYRDSEQIIGEALQDVRKYVILATKSKALDRNNIFSHVKRSLSNLKTDYIDLFQLHYVKDNNALRQIMDPKYGAYKALLELKSDGVIKHIGIASHNSYVFKEIINTKLFDTIQLPVNLLEHECDHIIKSANKNNIGIISMKPFAGGTLTKSLNKLQKFYFSSEEIKKLALEYVYSTGVTTVIPGMGTKEEVDENIDIVLNKIGYENYPTETINEIVKKIGKTFCRRCQYCEPCPNKVNISAILRIIKYYEDYDLPSWAKEQYKAIAYNYNDCKKCGICEKKCPYHLNIINELERIHNILK